MYYSIDKTLYITVRSSWKNNKTDIVNTSNNMSWHVETTATRKLEVQLQFI